MIDDLFGAYSISPVGSQAAEFILVQGPFFLSGHQQIPGSALFPFELESTSRKLARAPLTQDRRLLLIHGVIFVHSIIFSP